MPPAPKTQINWLELARLAAGPTGDLNAGIQRLATLAAATHRATPTTAPPLSPAARGRRALTPSAHAMEEAP